MSWRVVFHPEVRGDLTAITELLEDYAGREAARRKLDEIEAAARSLGENPHRGTRRDEVAPGLRAIPAGRRGVIAFGVDEERVVLVHAITYGGADWMGRARAALRRGEALILVTSLRARAASTPRRYTACARRGCAPSPLPGGSGSVDPPCGEC